MTPRPERLGSPAAPFCPEAPCPAEPLLPGRVLAASGCDVPSGPATARSVRTPSAHGQRQPRDQEVEPVVAADHRGRGVRVGFGPGVRDAPPAALQLDLEAGEHAVALLDVVQLGPGVDAPEERAATTTGVGQGLLALDHEEVFPEPADVVAARGRREVLDHGVAHTEVQEVHLLHLGDLLAQVPAEPPEPRDDERLLQQIQVRIDGVPAHRELPGQLVDRNLRPDLECQQPQEVMDLASAPYPGQLQNVLVEIGGAHLPEVLRLVRVVVQREDLRVGAVDQQRVEHLLQLERVVQVGQLQDRQPDTGRESRCGR